MAHYSRLSKIVIDVPPADHGRALAFWNAATGRPLAQFDRHPEYHGAALHSQEFWLLIHRLEDGPGRVHIDIHTDDRPPKWPGWRDSVPNGVQQVHSWQVMRDTAGLLFCVILYRSNTRLSG